jgi:hypothetical protein
VSRTRRTRNGERMIGDGGMGRGLGERGWEDDRGWTRRGGGIRPRRHATLLPPSRFRSRPATPSHPTRIPRVPAPLGFLATIFTAPTAVEVVAVVVVLRAPNDDYDFDSSCPSFLLLASPF